jgi:hypothetical protein
MTIYLYVKTHNKTGLKYLGKTNNKDPHKYSGSGKIWLRHLNKHGHDYNTEILKECQNKDEVKKWGLYYSSLWNIVESKEWANLKPELGDGGSSFMSVKNRKLLSERMKKNNPTLKKEVREKISDKKKEHVVSEETREKLRKHNLGKKLPEEQCLKRRGKNLGDTNPSAKRYEIKDPEGNIFIVHGKLKSFCKEHNLRPGSIIDLAKGRLLSYKGWEARYSF